jgi:hypothetical protein
MALSRKAAQKKAQRKGTNHKPGVITDVADSTKRTATEALKKFLSAGLRSLDEDELARLQFFCEIGGRFNFQIKKIKKIAGGGYMCGINVIRPTTPSLEKIKKEIMRRRAKL